MNKGFELNEDELACVNGGGRNWGLIGLIADAICDAYDGFKKGFNDEMAKP